MRETARRALAVSVMLQGAGHTVVGTPLAYDRPSREALWFAAGGLAMMLIGLVNLPSPGSPGRGSRRAILAANTVWWSWTCALCWVSLSPPAVVHWLLVSGLLVICLVSRRSAHMTGSE